MAIVFRLNVNMFYDSSLWWTVNMFYDSTCAPKIVFVYVVELNSSDDKRNSTAAAHLRCPPILYDVFLNLHIYIVKHKRSGAAYAARGVSATRGARCAAGHSSRAGLTLPLDDYK